MSAAFVLALFSALFGVALALTVAIYERRSIAHWAFLAGMAVLAAESIFSGLSADALLLEEIVYWQNWRLVALSFLPGFWLFFSLSYGRGNYREFLKKWRLPLAAAFLAPVGLALLFHGKLIASIGRTEATGHWILGLGTPGIILNLLFLDRKSVV